MVIQSRRVWISGQFLEAALKVEDGKIVQIYPYGTVEADVDYGTKRIVPGFIDVHTHGAYGFDTNDAELDETDSGRRRDWYSSNYSHSDAGCADCGGC